MNDLARPASPVFSLVSILAIVAATLSFTTGPGVSLLMAIAAIVLGLVGVLISVLPSRRGGIVSLLSVFAGAVGIIVAIIRIFFSAARHL